MSKPFGSEPWNPDSTEDLLAGWNIDDPDDPDWPLSSTAPEDARRKEPSAGRSRGIAELPSAESQGIFAGFGVEAGWGELSIGLKDAIGGNREGKSPRSDRDSAGAETVRGQTKGEARPTANGSRRTRAQGYLPLSGDELAGFRIIQELGRGAFARVYLAEEIHLGRRLVAIKVSRSEGEEPQILARLQHAHIVPVHSVCDDPETGLRVLCMPYLGGANLAQVLDATGGLEPTEHGGRSLVKALDRFSQRLPRPDGDRPLGSSQPPGSARPSKLSAAPSPTDRASPPEGLEGSVGVTRFRSLFSRLVGTSGNGPNGPRSPETEQDQHQPSRLFLRQASAIQAAAWIVARLAEGLEHAHTRGALHRDLKPANILLAADGTPMLLDFNLAAENRPASAEGEIRKALIGGTLPYMAPEHLDAFNPRGSTAPEAVDERADIYALGLILFEMLSGEPPFPAPAPGTTVFETLELYTETRRLAPSLRARCPQIPWSLDALAARCLEFEPDRRYARAGDLAEDLRRFLEDLPMKHCPEPSLRERMGKFARRHPALCGSTSIALFSLVLLVGMGTAVSFAVGVVRDLTVRVQRQRFESDFTETQFLLNTAGASDNNLAKGIAKARQCFTDLGLRVDGPAPLSGWILDLPQDEQRRLRAQAVELIMLEARAGILWAKKFGSESDRRKAIERAIARLNRAEHLGDHATTALFDERARFYAALGESELSERDRIRAARTPPTTSHDWTLLGTTLLAASDLPGAEDALRHALRLELTSFWTWFILGHCHYSQGRFLEAAGDFSVCSARGPSFAWAHFNRGLALAKAGRLLDARDAYDRALRLEPDFVEALVDRALVELELNQLDAALSDLTRAVALGRQDLPVRAARGETLARLGRRAEAERDFADLIARHPDDPVVRVARGMTRIGTDPREARSDFEFVLSRDSRHAAASYGLALSIRAEDPRAAIRLLDTALDTNPHLIDAIQLRALICARLGDRASLEDVERLLETPTSHRLYNAACAVALYADQARDPGRLPHALQLLGRAIKAGFPAADAAVDPDLSALHTLPEFRRLVARDVKAP
jgi:eukaryotic-like serine/threonine-protein kinase